MIGTVLYEGKSVTSSSFFSALGAGGFKIWGGGVKESLKWAYPSYLMGEILWYFNAFLRIADIGLIYNLIYLFNYNIYMYIKLFYFLIN